MCEYRVEAEVENDESVTLKGLPFQAGERVEVIVRKARRYRPASACAAIFDESGRVCLILRKDNKHWAIPGGAIEEDETAAAAAVREVKEETDLEVKVVRLVGVYSNPQETTITYKDGNTRIWVAVVFECAVVGGTEKPNPDEVLKIEWHSPDVLPDPMLPGHVVRVRDAVLGRDMLSR